MERKGFRVGVPRQGTYVKLLETTDVKYGGSGALCAHQLTSRAGLCDYRDHSIGFDLAPYDALIFLIPEAKKGSRRFFIKKG